MIIKGEGLQRGLRYAILKGEKITLKVNLNDLIFQ